MKYLIVECTPLNDQYECEANRTPLFVVEDYSKYQCYGYDIYQIMPDGFLAHVQNYNDYPYEEEEDSENYEDDCDYEVGFDPYMGCFTDEC